MIQAVLERVVHRKTNKPISEVKQLLEDLDLGCIKFKLMDPEEGEGWTREQADEAEIQYKRFLFLCVTSGQVVVPTKAVDAFWHTHILDTEKYRRDCNHLFGLFLDHFPYLGLRGEEDVELLQRSFQETCRLYEETFGEPYGVKSVDCGPTECGPTCGVCGADCEKAIKAADCENCGSCGASCGVGGGRTRPTVEQAISARQVFA